MRDLSTFIALNRFGLGAAPGEAERAGGDPRGWVKSQISRRQDVPEVLARFPSSAHTLKQIHEARLEGPDKLRPTTRELFRNVFNPEVVARARNMIATDKPFAERMVLFWSNHFTVSRTRAIIGPAIPAFEREVIRPHIFGSFETMLKAVSSHPCMLTYLDNVASVGPKSQAGERRARRNGNTELLNENLAREILELHTLGVNGGYTQQDIVEFAKVLSGWGHGGMRMRRNPNAPNAPQPLPVHGGFEFNARTHEPGPKTILGKTYEEEGVNEGLKVLRDLARHPSTAKFIATKLVRHFAADDPPPAAIEKIAKVFTATNGDLGAVSRALADLDEVWATPLPKVKSHYEMVISTLRVAGIREPRPQMIFLPLRELGQLPFAAPSPQGWGDTAKNWIAPEALMRRIEWLRGVAAKAPLGRPPAAVLDDAIGPVASDATRLWVSRAPSADAALAMIFASPEFQRR